MLVKTTIQKSNQVTKNKIRFHQILFFTPSHPPRKTALSFSPSKTKFRKSYPKNSNTPKIYLLFFVSRPHTKNQAVIYIYNPTAERLFTTSNISFSVARPTSTDKLKLKNSKWDQNWQQEFLTLAFVLLSSHQTWAPFFRDGNHFVKNARFFISSRQQTLGFLRDAKRPTWTRWRIQKKG